MSAPSLSRRHRPEGGLPVDEEELSRFRAWLVGRGYADRTATEWIRRVRWAFAHGCAHPDDVDAVFWNLSQPRRSGFRQALGAFVESRRAGR